MRSARRTEPAGGRTRLIGVTGRIGAGKSTLCQILSERPGCRVIDADRLGHEALSASPEIRRRLIARFGAGILDGEGRIVREALAGRVFEDPAAREALNEIVHPWIVERILSRLADLRLDPRVAIVLLDAALLLDWRAALPLDSIVWVSCPDGIAIERLRARGLTPEQAHRRLAVQSPEEAFRESGAVEIRNDGSIERLREQAEILWQSWQDEGRSRSGGS